MANTIKEFQNNKPSQEDFTAALETLLGERFNNPEDELIHDALQNVLYDYFIFKGIPKEAVEESTYMEDPYFGGDMENEPMDVETAMAYLNDELIPDWLEDLKEK